MFVQCSRHSIFILFIFYFNNYKNENKITFPKYNISFKNIYKLNILSYIAINFNNYEFNYK